MYFLAALLLIVGCGGQSGGRSCSLASPEVVRSSGEEVWNCPAGKECSVMTPAEARAIPVTPNIFTCNGDIEGFCTGEGCNLGNGGTGGSPNSGNTSNSNNPNEPNNSVNTRTTTTNNNPPGIGG